DFPEASTVGKIGRPLVHQSRRAVGQRPVNNIGMACHPADIRRAPVNVVFFDVENQVVGHGCSEKVSRGGVNDAFRLAGGSAGVKDIEQVLGIHRFGGTLVGGLGDEVVPQQVPSRGEGRAGGLANSFDNHNFF